MAVNEYFHGSEGALWIQPGGPNQDVEYLGCYELGDLTEPRGDIVMRRCQDAANPGKWIVSMVMQQPADRPTTSIVVGLGPTRDWLERNMDCPMPIYIHQRKCGRADDYTNYLRGQVFENGIITSTTQTNLRLRESNEMAEVTYEISGDVLERYYPYILEALVSTAPVQINDVVFCNVANCAGYCGPETDLCHIGYAVCHHDAANAAEVLRTADGGTTWAETTTDPYAVNDDDILSVICFPIDQDTHRVMVVRNNASAVGGALDIAYSDDAGVTWNLVVVGNATDIAYWNGALFALNERNVWLCWGNAAANAGYISFSDDGGLSWTLQHTTDDPMRYVRFCDEDHGICVGDDEEVVITTDGGATWAAPTTLPTPAGTVDAMCCDILTRNKMWVGFSSGELWYTEDGGVTWFQRTFDLPVNVYGATYSINDIMFVDEFHGAFVFEYQRPGPVDSGSMYFTNDGGRVWIQNLNLDTDRAWNACWVCDWDRSFAVGDVAAAGMIHTLNPAP